MPDDKTLFDDEPLSGDIFKDPFDDETDDFEVDESIFDDDNPLPTSKDVKSELPGLIAVDAATKGHDPRATLLAVESQPHAKTLNDLGKEGVDTLSDTVDEAFHKGMADGDPEIVAKTADRVRAVNHLQQTPEDLIMMPYRAIVEKLYAGNKTVSKEVRDKMANALFFRAVLANSEDAGEKSALHGAVGAALGFAFGGYKGIKTGWYLGEGVDTLGHYAEMVLPFIETAQRKEFLGASLGDVFEIPTMLHNLKTNFNRLPAEEQRVVFFKILDLAAESFDNRKSAAIFVEHLLRPQADSTGDYLYTAGDIVDVAFIFGPVIKNLIKNGSLSLISSLARRGVRASALDQALADPEGAGRALATDPMTSAVSTQPISEFKRMFLGAAEGVEQEFVEIRGLFQKYFRDFQSESLGLGLTREELVATGERAVEAVNRVHNITDADFEITEAGEILMKFNAQVHPEFGRNSFLDEIMERLRIGSGDISLTEVSTEWLRREFNLNEQDALYQLELLAQQGNITPADALGFSKVLSYNQPLERVPHDFLLQLEKNDVTGYFSPGFSIKGNAVRGLLSPTALFNSKDKDFLVNGLRTALFKQEVLRTRYMKALEQARKPIRWNVRSQRRVSALLQEGRDTGEGVVFTTEELVARGFSNNEIDAYRSTRILMDEVFEQTNLLRRTELAVTGHKEIFDSISGTKDVGKVYKTVDEALSAFRHGLLELAYTDAVGEPMAILSEEVIRATYERGGSFVRYLTPKDAGEYGSFTHGIINTTQIRDLPHYVLHKKVGYIPREYADLLYLVKTKILGRLNGKDGQVLGTKTLTYTDSHANAKKYVADLAKGRPARDGEEAKEPIESFIMNDREISITESLDQGHISLSSGLYTGKRAQEPLKYFNGKALSEAKFIDPIVSITRNLEALATRMPLAQFRHGLMKRWENHAAKYANHHGTFQEGHHNLGTDVAPEIRNQLIRFHDHISTFLNIPSREEQIFTTNMRRTAEWIDEKNFWGKGHVSKAIHKFDHSDPIAAIKSATFHTYMGMFNMSHFVIQAMGATVGLSVDPINGAKSLKGALSLTLGDQMFDPHALDVWNKKIARSDIDLEGVSELQQGWIRSGLRESVVNSNGDFQAMAQGYPADQSLVGRLFSEGVRGVSDAGLYPFKMGELFNRRFAYAASYHAWKGNPANALRNALDDDSLKEIFDHSNVLLLEMDRINKAPWQDNKYTALGTQFFQIHAKFLETILGGKTLSKGQRASLVAGQVAMFGARDVPIIGGLLNLAYNRFANDGEPLTEEQKNGINGFVGTAVNGFMGVDTEVIKRTAIASDIFQSGVDVLYGDKSLVEGFMGASGGMFSRVDRALDFTYRALHTQMTSVESIPPAFQQAVIEGWMSIFSSADKAVKARLLFETGILYDNKGAMIDVVGEVNFQTKVALLMGFTHKQASELYALGRENFSETKRIKVEVDAVMDLMVRIQSTGDESANKTLGLLIAAVVNNPLKSDTQRDLLKDSLIARISNPKTKREKILNKRMKLWGAATEAWVPWRTFDPFNTALPSSPSEK